jgi:NitT/TauT family transport system substrate-binding protein
MTNVTIILQAKTEGWVVPSLAVEMGEFKKENLNVKIAYDALPSDIILALNHGQADVGYLGTSALLFNSIAAGADVKIVMDGGEPPPGVSGIFVKSSLIADPGSFDACGFKGLRVGIGPTLAGSTPAVALGTYLSQHCPSVTMHDVSLSPLNGSNALVALETGALQAADLYAPSSSQAISSGAAKLAVEVPAGAGAMVMGSILTSHPQVAEAIARALLRTQRTYLQGDYHSSPQVAADIAKILGVPASFVTSPANPQPRLQPERNLPEHIPRPRTAILPVPYTQDPDIFPGTEHEPTRRRSSADRRTLEQLTSMMIGKAHESQRARARHEPIREPRRNVL